MVVKNSREYCKMLPEVVRSCAGSQKGHVPVPAADCSRLFLIHRDESSPSGCVTEALSCFLRLLRLILSHPSVTSSPLLHPLTRGGPYGLELEVCESTTVRRDCTREDICVFLPLFVSSDISVFHVLPGFALDDSISLPSLVVLSPLKLS